MQKRLFSLLISFIMITTLTPISCATLMASEIANVRVESVVSEPNETVQIPVLITTNPGIAGAMLHVVYDDSALTLKNITRGDVLSDGTFNVNTSRRTIQWYNDADDVTSTGTLFSLEFTVGSDAIGGSNYSVGVELLDGVTANFSNYDSDIVGVTFESGSITIIDQPEEYSVTVNSGTGSGMYGVGTDVSIRAFPPDSGKRFKEWTGVGRLTFTNGSAMSEEADFTMPSNDVTITATYEDIPISTYRVTVNSGSGSGEYESGTNVTIKANTPKSGKRFKEWTGVSGLNFTSGNSISDQATFTMPNKSVSITATYEDIPIQTYTVTVNKGSGSGEYESGTNVTIKANTPESGKRFKEWTGVSGLNFTSGNSISDQATFTMPNKSVSITATYEDIPIQTYTVTVNKGSGSGEYESGTNVTIKANTPESGKRFKEWTGVSGLNFASGNSASDQATFTMPNKSVSITATYEDIPIQTYTVTVNKGSGGGSYEVGANVTIKANTPENGKRFKEWTGVSGLSFTNGNSSSDQATFTMPSKSVTITAIYEDIPARTYSVTVSHGSGSGAYEQGASVRIRADAAGTGRQFKEWTGVNGLTFISGNKATRDATFTMPAKSVSVTATYEDIPEASYAIILPNNISGGTVTSNQSAATEGTTITLTLTPDNGHEIGSLSVTYGSGKKASVTEKGAGKYTFVMPASQVEVSVRFVKVEVQSYQITTSPSYDGTISVSPQQAVSGTTITIVVSPFKGYEMDTLFVRDQNNNNVRLTFSGNAYTFTMPASNVLVTATYKITDDEVATLESVENPFSDVTEGPFYDAILWAAQSGVTTGTTSSTFTPSGTCTRAQAVTFLWRSAGKPEPLSSMNPFSDISPSSYYYKAVLWAVEQEITKGTTPTTFSPNQTVSRGQIVTFLHRWSGSPNGISYNPFVDVWRGTGSYYYDAVLWAVQNKITNGTSSTTFEPSLKCTRGQIVTFLYRYYNN